MTRSGTRHRPADVGTETKRRVVFADAGDIALIDGTRRVQITRTTGGESSPRWARNDTHVTYVRDGNLFIVPVAADVAAGSAVVAQLTDVAVKRPDPRSPTARSSSRTKSRS